MHTGDKLKISTHTIILVQKKQYKFYNSYRHPFKPMPLLNKHIYYQSSMNNNRQVFCSGYDTVKFFSFEKTMCSCQYEFSRNNRSSTDMDIVLQYGYHIGIFIFVHFPAIYDFFINCYLVLTVSSCKK